MGEAPLVGLGLALARPRQEVIVFNGDGCMLMNLGSLVTIAAAGPPNFTLVLLENGIYEVTGGQSTAAGASNEVDFAAMARAAGWPSVFEFDDADRWRREIASVMRSPGPRFVCLHVAPVGDDYQLPAFSPMAERLAAFKAALGT
jgi:thiamine pyrophosphate-dependent acetolactate synthase large subunit-like protein